MKKIATLFITICLSTPVWAGIDCYRNTSDACMEVAANALPKSIEEFKALRNKIGKTPYGGATLIAYALMVRLTDPALGDKLIILATAESQLKKGESGVYKGYSGNYSVNTWLRRMGNIPHCIRSYAVGSSPENQYKLDSASVALRFRKQSTWVPDSKTGKYKVFLCSTGTDSCRPIHLERNKQGFWKASNYGSIIMSCRPPVSTEPDASDEL